jgi:uncharacterized SAM-binding protein YcdF (DUF218 family)
MLKKFISPLLSPVPLCVEILLAGVILLWFTRRQKAGKWAVSCGLLSLILVGNRNFAGWLLRPLERQYPPLVISHDAEALEHRSSVEFVVVLGGGHSPDSSVSLTSQLDDDSTARLVEGIRLYRELRGSKLLVSGGPVLNAAPAAPAMARVAEALGVNPQDIVVEAESQDTEEEARLIRHMVGSKPFVLVTSASHMPRSMALFTKLGMTPLPAPTDYLARRSQVFSPDDVYPSHIGLRAATRAVHEYLGLVWGKLRGKI